MTTDPSKFALKDSGKRLKFKSGAVRDPSDGKGSYFLLSPFGLRRIVAIYEKGAAKYEPRNWEKGMNISRCLDSAIRHLMQYMAGQNDEDHVAQAAWNCIAIMHMEKMIEEGLLPPELDDLPKYWQKFKNKTPL